ncbi:hypothetical protein [Blastomonas fulva]|uniref:Integron n=1 Tax=Blastomonas fulva TaxID=1550728 RepID=A0ABN5B7A4_9SPHN|nr:hypothetical protein [Blastomonas fulva]ASR52088.1 hypothetical protein B5J99_12000 [Blastomonas fulva]
MKAMIAGTALLALVTGSLAQAQFLAQPQTGSLAQPPFVGANRPVMLKADDGLDPCALGEITGAGEGAIMVFPADDTSPDAIDFLSDGERVWMCDSDDASDAIGIIYTREPDADCKVGSPVSADRVYAGPCKSGWINSEWVKVIAG